MVAPVRKVDDNSVERRAGRADCHPSGRIAVEVNADDGETARRAAVELGRRVIPTAN